METRHIEWLSYLFTGFESTCVISCTHTHTHIWIHTRCYTGYSLGHSNIVILSNKFPSTRRCIPHSINSREMDYYPCITSVLFHSIIALPARDEINLFLVAMIRRGWPVCGPCSKEFTRATELVGGSVIERASIVVCKNYYMKAIILNSISLIYSPVGA